MADLTEYDLNEQGRMTVFGETGHWYRTMDLTFQVEALQDFVRLTLENELIQELDFLASTTTRPNWRFRESSTCPTD